MSIKVNDFRWEPGTNDAEYIKLLESSRDEWERIAQKAISKLKTLSKAQEPIETRLHLCESCTKKYPECDATADGVEFGNGTGNDNIIGCTAYTNRWKAQKPRVMTWGEVRATLKAPVWKETKSRHNALYQGWVLAYDIQTGQGITGTRLGMAEPSGRVVWYKAEDYGKTWRCWTSRPTEAEREVVKWE